MTHDRADVREFARSYTEAWCSHDHAKVAAHYVPGGTIAINDGEPTEIAEVARSFIEAFPDIEVFMDDVVFEDDTVEYRWTFTGTNSGPAAPERPFESAASSTGFSATSCSSPRRRATTTRTNMTASSRTGRRRCDGQRAGRT